jgi:hypothetical protein
MRMPSVFFAGLVLLVSNAAIAAQPAPTPESAEVAPGEEDAPPLDSSTADPKDRPPEGEDSEIMALDQAIFFFLPGPAWGFYYFEYQQAFAPRHSFNVSAEYINLFYSGVHLMRFWGLYRFKLIGRDVSPLDGLTLVPALSMTLPLDGRTTLFNMLLYLSYQYVFEFGLALQVFVGAGYGVATTPVEDYEVFTDFSPSYGLSVGWAF